MKWKSHRNGGNSNSTRMAQRSESRERDGHGLGFSGHHSWKKGKSGGNKIGASTMPLLAWSASERKYEEHHSFAAKQAELDAISEGLAAAWEEEFGPYRFSPDYVSDQLLDDALMDGLPPGVTFNGQSWDLSEQLLYDALMDGLPPGVTFNGQSWDPTYDDYYDRCDYCGRPF